DEHGHETFVLDDQNAQYPAREGTDRRCSGVRGQFQVHDNGASISQVAPSAGYSSRTWAPSSLANARSRRRVPNPLRRGGSTEGPPRSAHRRLSFSPLSSTSTVQAIRIEPPLLASAPYFAALVHNSW